MVLAPSVSIPPSQLFKLGESVCMSVGCWQQLNTAELQFWATCYSTKPHTLASSVQDACWHREVDNGHTCISIEVDVYAHIPAHWAEYCIARPERWELCAGSNRGCYTGSIFSFLSYTLQLLWEYLLTLQHNYSFPALAQTKGYSVLYSVHLWDKS